MFDRHSKDAAVAPAAAIAAAAAVQGLQSFTIETPPPSNCELALDDLLPLAAAVGDLAAA